MSTLFINLSMWTQDCGKQKARLKRDRKLFAMRTDKRGKAFAKRMKRGKKGRMAA